MMKLEEIKKIKLEYYDDFLLRKLITEMKLDKDTYREVATINNNTDFKKVAFRGITFSDVENLKKTLFNKKYKTFYDNDASLYISVARLKRLPLFPFKNRREYTNPFFKNEYVNFIKGYDLYLDFDIVNASDLKENDISELISKRMEEFLSEIYKVVSIIRCYNLDSEIVFSGNRGFKILIKNDIYQPKTIMNIHRKIIKRLCLKYCDISGSFIPSKLMKCNFGLVFKDNCKVVLPLKDSNIYGIFQILEKEKTFDFFEYMRVKKYFENGYILFNEYTSSFFDVETDKNNIRDFIKELKK